MDFKLTLAEFSKRIKEDTFNGCNEVSYNSKNNRIKIARVF